MIDPVCFHVGSWPVRWYGVMTAMGFLAAVWHMNREGRRAGLPEGFGSELAFWMVLAGILGARIAYVAANWPDYRADPLSIVRIDQGGLIYYGGFLGAAVAMLILARTGKVPLWSMADLAVCALPLGHAFGRIGCFLNGCCYGIPSRVPWCVEVEGACRHPVQLYESAFNLLLCVALTVYYRRRPAAGRVLMLYLLTYPVFRFAIEFLRGDPRLFLHGTLRLHWWELNVSQELSLALFLGGLVLWWYLRRYSSPPGGGNRPQSDR